MQAAFTDAADFSLLSDTPLKIDAVQQKTYLQVDESGTIGAAVTSIPMMEATGGPDRGAQDGLSHAPVSLRDLRP